MAKRTGWFKLYKKNYEAEIQNFEKGSEYGIDGGRISRLFIKRAGDTLKESIIAYERGWYRRLPKGANKELKTFYKKIIKNYN